MAKSVRVAARPPIVYVFGLVLSFGLKSIVSGSLTLSDLVYLPYFGVGSFIMGSIVAYWGWTSLLSDGVDPYFKSVKTFVANGPFKYSRNPIYVGFTLMYIGVSFFMRSYIPFIVLPLIILYIHHGVIKREESYMFERFGETYIQYKKDVRRWV